MTDGIAIIDKPPGWTSHDVVARVRRLFGERRVGHTGTLDPFATGVLVVLLGRATRLAQFLAGAEKEYEALIRFGYATETGDATGARRMTGETATTQEAATTGETSATPQTASTSESASAGAALDCAAWDEAQIEAALATLRGEFEQVPPMYSAKKVKGKKLYELARQGLEIERKAVRVFVREFAALPVDGRLMREGEAGTCELRARVVCSAGTYVRVLAESLGERLGVGAHLSALRRTRAGAFRIEQAHTLEDLAETARDGGGDALAAKLLSLDAALSTMPQAHLTAEESRRARHGAALSARAACSSSGGSIVDAASLRDGARVRLLDERGELIAVGEYDEAGGRLRVRVLLVAEGK